MRGALGAAAKIWAAAIVSAALAFTGCGSSDDEPGFFQRSLEESEQREDRIARREAKLPASKCNDHDLPQVCRIAASTFGARYVEQVRVVPDPGSPDQMAIAYGFRLPGLEPAYAVSLAVKSEAVDAFRQTFKQVPHASISYVEVGAYAPEGRRVFDASVRGDEVHGDPLDAMQINQIDPALEEP